MMDIILLKWDFDEIVQYSSFNIYDKIKQFNKYVELEINQELFDLLKNSQVILYNASKHSKLNDFIERQHINVFVTDLNLPEKLAKYLINHKNIDSFNVYLFGPSAYGGIESDEWLKRINIFNILKNKVINVTYIFDFLYLESFEQDVNQIKNVAGDLYKNIWFIFSPQNFKLWSFEKLKKWREIRKRKEFDGVFRTPVIEDEYRIIGPLNLEPRQHIILGKIDHTNCIASGVPSVMCFNCFAFDGVAQKDKFIEHIKLLRVR